MCNLSFQFVERRCFSGEKYFVVLDDFYFSPAIVINLYLLMFVIAIKRHTG